MSKFTSFIKAVTYFMVLAVIGTVFVKNAAAFRREAAALSSTAIPSPSGTLSIIPFSETEIPTGGSDSSVISVSAPTDPAPPNTTPSSSVPYSSPFSAENSPVVTSSRPSESVFVQPLPVVSEQSEGMSVQSTSVIKPLSDVPAQSSAAVKPPESISVQSSSEADEPTDTESVRDIPQSSPSSDISEPSSTSVVSTVPESTSAVSSGSPKSVPVDTASEPVSDYPEFDKLNINTASVEELCSLGGIGEIKAKAVIAYRIENGGFSSIDELLNVKGIGKSVLEKIRPYITV